MQKINELQLAKELMKFPSITPRDAGVIKFLEKKLKKMGFKTKISVSYTHLTLRTICSV